MGYPFSLGGNNYFEVIKIFIINYIECNSNVS